jgi:hypothetical protein
MQVRFGRGTQCGNETYLSGPWVERTAVALGPAGNTPID